MAVICMTALHQLPLPQKPKLSFPNLSDGGQGWSPGRRSSARSEVTRAAAEGSSDASSAPTPGPRCCCLTAQTSASFPGGIVGGRLHPTTGTFNNSAG